MRYDIDYYVIDNVDDNQYVNNQYVNNHIN